MTVAELVEELKQYLRIDPTDTDDDIYLTNFVEAAAGYVASVYRYHIVDSTLMVVKQISPSLPYKLYLPRGPVKTATIIGEDGNPISASFRVINNTILFDEPQIADGEYLTVNYEVGISNDIESRGDVENVVALAAWLYRTADKGLDGLESISTGVKEGAKMFSGIPMNITQYFETRQVIRL